MVERGEHVIPFFPCMANASKDCINCRFLGSNIENFRKLRWNQYVRYIFSHEVADDPPTIEQLIELLPMTGELKKMGETITRHRRKFVEKMSRIEELGLRCPILESENDQ